MTKTLLFVKVVMNRCCSVVGAQVEPIYQGLAMETIVCNRTLITGPGTALVEKGHERG